MQNRKPTLADVATRAGVSKSAAAAVFGDKQSTVRLSPATRERVMAAAQELRYRPHAIATSLRRQSTNTIGYYTGYVSVDLRVPFHNHVLNGVRQACDSHRRHLLLQGSFPNTPIEQMYNELTDGKIDGVILHAYEGHPLLNFLREDRLPAISIAEPLSGFPGITIDDVAGSNMLAEHLHKLGHKRVLYRIPEYAYSTTSQFHSSSVRYPQFAKMAAEYGIEVVMEDKMQQSLQQLGEVTDHEIELLSGKGANKITAVVCWNDLLAHQVMRYCKATGISVPGDIAVMGFDGYVPEPVFEAAPAYDLTTIRIPWIDAGFLAAELLLKLIGGEEIPAQTMVPVTFVRGNTS